MYTARQVAERKKGQFSDTLLPLNQPFSEPVEWALESSYLIEHY